MTKATGTGGRKPRTAKSRSQRPAGVGAKEAVEKAIQTIEGKLKSEDLKATIGDFIRLLQLQRELRDDSDPKEIKVTWVEPIEIESVIER